MRLLYPEQEFLCPGDEAIFICQTTDSQTLEWRSDQYTINSSSYLKFASYDHIGRILNSLDHDHEAVFANLTNSSRDDGGVIMMESQFHIRVEPNISSTFYVQCLLDNLEMDIITLRVLGMCIIYAHKFHR